MTQRKTDKIYDKLSMISLAMFFNVENWEPKENKFLFTFKDVSIVSDIPFDLKSKKTFLNLIAYENSISRGVSDEVELPSYIKEEDVLLFASSSLRIENHADNTVLAINIVERCTLGQNFLYDLSLDKRFINIFFPSFI